MDVYQVNNASGSYTSASTDSNLTSDYQDFLELLTVQLQNQDPTDPMDTSEITSETAEYSMLEQQVLTNEMLDSLMGMMQDAQSGTPTDYLDQEVTFLSSTNSLKDGAAEWEYEAPVGINNAKLTIADQNNNIVYSTSLGNLDEGINNYSWDGIDNDGEASQDGLYTLSIITEDDTETLTKVDNIFSIGTVSKVDWVSGEYQLTIDDQTIDSALVTAVSSKNQS